MKVQIVYLSPEDDIHSTRDMLSWVKAPRALLVWPDQGRVLTRQLDLVLLKRYSFQRQIQIGLLTFDREVRDEAYALGIPVFDSLDNLPEDHWKWDQHLDKPLQRARDTDPDPSRNNLPPDFNIGWFDRLRTLHKLYLVLGVLLSLTLIIGLLMPSAQIILSPSLVKKNFSFTIDLAKDGTGGSNTLLVPIQTMKLQSEGKSSIESSGLTLVPTSTATGKVIFTSLSQEEIEIPMGTTLRTTTENGIRFRTTQPAILKAEIGSSVEVSIEALTPGWKGNVPANSISLVDGPLGLLVEVSNQEPTSGGRAEIRSMVLQADMVQLEQELIQDLAEVAEREWAVSLPAERILVEGSLELQEVLDRQFDHVPGDVADMISLELSLEFSALALAIKDLQKFTMINYADDLSSDYLPVPGAFTFFPQIQETTDGSGGRWINVAIEVDTYHAFDSGSMKRMVRGQPISDATDLLIKRYPLSIEPEFILKPSWYPILPVVDQRIDFSWSWEIGM